jgi:hypothetical protein
MRRRQWLFLTLSLVLLTVALAGVRMLSGSGSVASAGAGTKIAIDMDEGTGWCDTIDDTASHAQADGNYDVAICLVDTTIPAGDFNIEVLYDSQLNACSNTGQSGAGLDANPDFIGNISNPSPTWTCSGGGLNYPRCDAGVAFITCGTVDDPGTVTGNWPIAVITFHVIAGSLEPDTLTFGTVGMYGYYGETLPACPDDGPTVCVGATDNKTGGEIAPTATFTAVPTATSTPSCGLPGQLACPTSTPTARAWTKTPSPGPTSTPGAGEPTSAPPPPPAPPPPSGGQQPSVTPPATGTGSGGVAWVSVLAWTLSGGAALSLILSSGLYLRRVRNR